MSLAVEAEAEVLDLQHSMKLVPALAVKEVDGQTFRHLQSEEELGRLAWVDLGAEMLLEAVMVVLDLLMIDGREAVLRSLFFELAEGQAGALVLMPLYFPYVGD